MTARLTAHEVKGVYEKVNNWGKWGAEDEIGAQLYYPAQACRGRPPSSAR